jgi:hypothetical protein
VSSSFGRQQTFSESRKSGKLLAMKKTQADAVVEVMEKNGGFANFNHLYQHVQMKDWGTKTPFASIRRIVQLDPRFFRLEPGLWALKSYESKLPFPLEVKTKSDSVKQEKFSHTYFQGLAVEIGNFRQFSTYVPAQDKNNKFLNQPLDEVTTAKQLFDFSYPKILKSAKTVDVIWFNKRNMPSTFIEVKHSTNMYNSLRKFGELQDFYADFIILAPEVRKAEFEEKRTATSYRDVKDRVKFWGYEYVSKVHSHLAELIALDKTL